MCSTLNKLVSLVKKGSYRIVGLDSAGVLSCWVLIEFSEGDYAGSLADLTLKVGGKIKLGLHSTVDLSDKLGVDFELDTFEVDFDPNDQNSFIFSTSSGVYYSKLYNRSDDSVSLQGGPFVRKLESSSVGDFVKVTSISYSDQGFVLVGFEEGSIGLYNAEFSSPLSIWYNACETAVQVIKWCTIYFSGAKTKAAKTDKQSVSKDIVTDSRFSSRLCEFFVIDMNENFYIWNLNKNIHKSIHKINFAEKHGGIDEQSLTRSIISNTCVDQSFYTGFRVTGNQMVYYFMNFKKGTKISRDKIESENKKSVKLLKILPSNAVSI